MKTRLLFTAIAAALFCQTAYAQVPRTISYQGILYEPDGAPVADGSYDISFRIYDSPDNGPALHSEAQTVTVIDGVFSAILGLSPQFPAALEFNKQYYLGISMAGASEMTPRTQFTAAPYALNAASAEVAKSLAPGATGVVTSVNGESGAVVLEGDGGTTISQLDNKIIIASEGGFSGLKNTDGTIDISDPEGPVATIGLADNAVTSAKVADGTITGKDLADGTLTLAKIDVSTADAGQVIAYNGTNLVFSEAGLVLPYVTSVETTDAFSITNTGSGASGRFIVDNATNTSHALQGETNANASWNGPAGVYGLHTGNSGIGVFGEATGSAVQGIPPRGIYGRSDEGIGVYGFSENNIAMSAQANGEGSTLRALNFGTGTAGSFEVRNGQSDADALTVGTNSTGNAVLGLTSGSGKAGLFQIDNTSNEDHALAGETNGDGHAILGLRTKATGTRAAIQGETSSSSNGSGPTVGASGVYGLAVPASGGGWSAGVRGVNNSTTGNGIGVVGYQKGSGWGVLGQAVEGTGVRAAAGGDGNALVAVYTGTSASTTSAANIAIFQAPPRAGGAAANRARIDATGRGFFNGGTVNNGADVAELFDVEGMHTEYEPGDVLAISTSTDRTVEKSSDPYSTLVVGVYATKPGVLLTETHVDADMSEQVPMGIVGVIPTKVSDENGSISRGDILVTSSIAGHAMKADPKKALENPGCIIGKALENFDGEGTGVIRVLVNVR